MDVNLNILPDDALDRIANNLSLASLTKLARACKNLHRIALSEVQFRKRLLANYGLGLEGLLSPDASFKSLYRDLHCQDTSVLRFQAIATDGGVDTSASNHMMYWVDNMFVDDLLEAYCSEIGKGVATFAVMQGGDTKQDEERRDRVTFLRHLLQRPLEHLLPVTQNGSYMHRPLESWSLFDLEHFLAELWAVGVGPPGPWLASSVEQLAELSSTPVSQVFERAERIVKAFNARFRSDAAQISPGTNTQGSLPVRKGLQNPHYPVFADPSNENLIMDADLMPQLALEATPSHYTIGIISHLEINRKGGFSCPLRTGAVLVGCNMHSLHACQAAHSEDVREHICGQGIVSLETPELSNLRTCQSFPALMQLVSDGDLPRELSVKVHRGRSCFQGVTVEFVPDVSQAGKRLFPALWFQFFSDEEDSQIREWEVAVLESSGGSPSLPGPLEWVAQHYDPTSAAAQRARGHDQFFSLDSATFPPEDVMPSTADSEAAQPTDPPPPPSPPRSETSDAAALPDPSQALSDSNLQDNSEYESESNSDEMSVDWDLGPEQDSQRGTCGRHKLKISLQKFRPASLVSVVLVDQENLMQAWRDEHPSPNIDVSYVRFIGKKVRIPCTTVFGAGTTE